MNDILTDNMKCSWCGRSVTSLDSVQSGLKSYHHKCVITRNIAGHAKDSNGEPYEPTAISLSQHKLMNDQLIASTKQSWKLAARESHERIVAKYNSSRNR